MTAAKSEGLPEYGKAQGCDRKDCPAPDFDAGFGLGGGGYGPYEYCQTCEHIVSKTCLKDGDE